MNDAKEPRNEAFVFVVRRPPLDRLFARLGFGRAFVPRPPDEEIEGLAPGYMATDVTVILDWRDRLRVLFSGMVHVETLHQADVMPRRLHSTSAVRVLPPNYPKPKSI